MASYDLASELERKHVDYELIPHRRTEAAKDEATAIVAGSQDGRAYDQTRAMFALCCRHPSASTCTRCASSLAMGNRTPPPTGLWLHPVLD